MKRNWIAALALSWQLGLGQLLEPERGPELGLGLWSRLGRQVLDLGQQSGLEVTQRDGQ